MPVLELTLLGAALLAVVLLIRWWTGPEIPS
jgi:hypothetical protein